VFNDVWRDATNVSIAIPACISCTLNGCIDCEGGPDGLPICKVCGEWFKKDGLGGCAWNSQKFTVSTLLFYALLLTLVAWIIIELTMAECGKVVNEDALKRGLIMRRRAQLFVSKEKQDEIKRISSRGDVAPVAFEHGRYSLDTDLHTLKSGRVMGPGMTLFMNWFIYIFIIGTWLCCGTLVFAPEKEEEKVLLDPCLQQNRIIEEGWNFRTENPVRDNRDWKEWAWAMWNYVGAMLITAIFLWLQHWLWRRMVKSDLVPSLREYCVQITHLPTDVTEGKAIAAGLMEWMEKMKLEKTAIVDVSIAYDLDSKHHEEAEQLLEDHLQTLANESSNIEKRDIPAPTSTSSKGSIEMARTLSTEIAETGKMGACFGGMFWVQLIALLLFQTPFQFCAKETKVVPTGEAEEKNNEKARDILKHIKGSGHAFVMMSTEAVARAFVGVGKATINIGESHKDVEIRFEKAQAEPEMIKWFDYVTVAPQWRIFRFISIAVLLWVSLNVWLMLFAAFLHFEIVTSGNTGATKGMAGLLVGMLVPLGNALIGGVIDLTMKWWGFRDGDDQLLWRQMLNVMINGFANIGEIYLIYKKVYNPVGWGVVDFFWHIRNKVAPLGVNPNVIHFQDELKSILFPGGMLVPILTIPLLSDFLPWFIGRLRLKFDMKLTGADAERIMKPGAVDPIGPYTDFLINFFLLTFASWISPGRYLIILWFALVLWTTLLYLNTRMNILRWQARSYFGSMKSHRCASYLLGIPLSCLAAALEHQQNPVESSGRVGFLLQFMWHFVFVRYVLEGLLPRERCFGKPLEEMQKHEFAPIATYKNTNPIRVLRRIYQKDRYQRGPDGTADKVDDDDEDIVYFRSDKWYLQKAKRGMQKGKSEMFDGEDDVSMQNVAAVFRSECILMAGDVKNIGVRGLAAASESVAKTRPDLEKTTEQVDEDLIQVRPTEMVIKPEDH